MFDVIFAVVIIARIDFDITDNEKLQLLSLKDCLKERIETV